MAGGVETGVGRVWDPLVRLTHWGIATAVIVNGMILRDDSFVHLWVGYAALGLLALRLLWGLIGPAEARFSAFPPSLSAARSHLAEIADGSRTEHRSHNPLGRLMVYAIWVTLSVVIASGLVQRSAPFPDDDDGISVFLPPISESYDGDGRDDDEGGEMSEVFEELHEVSANLLLLLALAHVGGVVFEMRRGDAGLIRRMTFGAKGRGQGA